MLAVRSATLEGWCGYADSGNRLSIKSANTLCMGACCINHLGKSSYEAPDSEEGVYRFLSCSPMLISSV